MKAKAAIPSVPRLPKSKAKKATLSMLEIEIPRLVKKLFGVPITGTNTLILHKFSDKATKMILDKQERKASKGKDAKDPIADFVGALHLLNGDNGTRDELIEKLHKAKVRPGEDVTKFFKNIKIGFPASGFKKAAVSACRNIDGIPMTLARGAFFVEADENDLVEIKYDRIIIREDHVRLNGATADIRHRPGVEGWRATLTVKLNPAVMSPEQVCNLIDLSGFAVGVGDNRPESAGEIFGQFELARKETPQ